MNGLLSVASCTLLLYFDLELCTGLEEICRNYAVNSIHRVSGTRFPSRTWKNGPSGRPWCLPQTASSFLLPLSIALLGGPAKVPGHQGFAYAACRESIVVRVMHHQRRVVGIHRLVDMTTPETFEICTSAEYWSKIDRLQTVEAARVRKPLERTAICKADQVVIAEQCPTKANKVEDAHPGSTQWVSGWKSAAWSRSST